MRGELGPNICRVCLEPSQRLQRIDESREEGEETPNEMLIQLLGISFSKVSVGVNFIFQISSHRGSSTFISPILVKWERSDSRWYLQAMQGGAKHGLSVS